MKSFILHTALAGVLLLSIASCKQKEPDTTPAGTGKAKLEFFNEAGGTALSMNGQWYRNAHRDSFQVTKFDYYISNIKLNAAGGSSYAEPESYHLVKQSDAGSRSFDLAHVPYGTYSSVTFMIGVDSLRNVSGAQDGALSTDNGMFWSWNTGYIMLKFEGNSPQSPNPNGALIMHAGGFSGNNSVLKTVTLNFDSPVEVKENGTPHIHLTADLLALFKSPNEISFATMNTIHMPGADARKFADNYGNMFSVTYAGY